MDRPAVTVAFTSPRPVDEAALPGDVVVGRALPAEVLVTSPDPISCRAAIAAVDRGDARAIVLTTSLDLLPLVSDAVAARCTIVPFEVREIASVLDGLTDRQVAVLQGVVTGLSREVIAKSLDVSLPTVKRELALVHVALGAPTRAGLIIALGGAPSS